MADLSDSQARPQTRGTGFFLPKNSVINPAEAFLPLSRVSPASRPQQAYHQNASPPANQHFARIPNSASINLMASNNAASSSSASAARSSESSAPTGTWAPQAAPASNSYPTTNRLAQQEQQQQQQQLLWQAATASHGGNTVMMMPQSVLVHAPPPPVAGPRAVSSVICSPVGSERLLPLSSFEGTAAFASAPLPASAGFPYSYTSAELDTYGFSSRALAAPAAAARSSKYSFAQNSQAAGPTTGTGLLAAGGSTLQYSMQQQLQAAAAHAGAGYPYSGTCSDVEDLLSSELMLADGLQALRLSSSPNLSTFSAAAAAGSSSYASSSAEASPFAHPAPAWRQSQPCNGPVFPDSSASSIVNMGAQCGLGRQLSTTSLGASSSHSTCLLSPFGGAVPSPFSGGTTVLGATHSGNAAAPWLQQQVTDVPSTSAVAAAGSHALSSAGSGVLTEEMSELLQFSEQLNAAAAAATSGSDAAAACAAAFKLQKDTMRQAIMATATLQASSSESSTGEILGSSPSSNHGYSPSSSFGRVNSGGIVNLGVARTAAVLSSSTVGMELVPVQQQMQLSRVASMPAGNVSPPNSVLEAKLQQLQAMHQLQMDIEAELLQLLPA